jgi:hypothetical protein
VKIGASLKSASVFLVELEQARIPLPWCPALCEDLYDAYWVWCTTAGIRPLAINAFVPEVMRLGLVHRVTVRVPTVLDVSALELFVKNPRRPRRVLLIGHQTRRTKFKDARAIMRGIRRFHWALKTWRLQLGTVDGTLIEKSRLGQTQVLKSRANGDPVDGTLIVARVAGEAVSA